MAIGIVERLSDSGRAFYDGLAPNEYHYLHFHYALRALQPYGVFDQESDSLNAVSLERTYPGLIGHVEVRVDGVLLELPEKEAATGR